MPEIRESVAEVAVVGPSSIEVVESVGRSCMVAANRVKVVGAVLLFCKKVAHPFPDRKTESAVWSEVGEWVVDSVVEVGAIVVVALGRCWWSCEEGVSLSTIDLDTVVCVLEFCEVFLESEESRVCREESESCNVASEGMTDTSKKDLGVDSLVSMVVERVVSVDWSRGCPGSWVVSVVSLSLCSMPHDCSVVVLVFDLHVVSWFSAWVVPEVLGGVHGHCCACVESVWGVGVL